MHRVVARVRFEAAQRVDTLAHLFVIHPASSGSGSVELFHLVVRERAHDWASAAASASLTAWRVVIARCQMGRAWNLSSAGLGKL